MKILDAHCDTLFSIGIHNADPEKCAVTAERLRAGGVSVQVFAIFAGSEGPAGHPFEKAVAMSRVLDRVGVPMLTGKLPDDMPDAPSGVVSIEGCEVFVGSLARLDELTTSMRVRMAALTWNNENELGYSAKSQSAEGLKPFGLKCVRELGLRGVLPDVSHLNDAGFWNLMEVSDLPPVASHSNCRALCPHFRNLTDDMIRALIEREGFMGMNFCPPFLIPEGVPNAEDVFRHIDHVCQMGGWKILGLGTDFDGIDTWPEGLASPADLPALLSVLRAHGYPEEAVEAIAGGNLWRVLKRAEAQAVL